MARCGPRISGARMVYSLLIAPGCGGIIADSAAEAGPREMADAAPGIPSISCRTNLGV